MDIPSSDAEAAHNEEDHELQQKMGTQREVAPRSFDDQFRAEETCLSLRFMDGQQNVKVELELLQDLAAGISCVLYDGALFLASHLVRHPQLLPQEGVVLELGCGTGCVGLVARALGARMIASDRNEKALCLAAQSAARSGLHGVHFVRWDWNDPIPQDCAGAKLILAADVCYSDVMLDPLLKALDAAAGEGASVIVALKARCASGVKGIKGLLAGAAKLFHEVLPLSDVSGLQAVHVEDCQGKPLPVNSRKTPFYLYIFKR